MSSAAPAPGRRRPRPPRAAISTALLAVLTVLVAAVVALSSPATASVPAGTTPTGGSGETTQGPQPSPILSTDYDGEVGGPHQDTPEEQTGRAVSTGTVVFIAAVILVTAAIVVTLAVRARRRRNAGQGDLS